MKVEGNFKDRGQNKWTAMLLLEHLTGLRDSHAKDDLTDRPELPEISLHLKNGICIQFDCISS
ncbi:hypothetical protein ABE073_02820 [Lederbergia citrisecunda]|uniref:hypothetical protein n=1 Tax=Lederbergia citrisecunda TaxID=2833583 RepID=UPI003D2CF805